MRVASSWSLAGCTVRAARALAVAGVFLAPLDAAAFSCELPGVAAPFRRTADVPTNTRIWCTEEPQWPIESIVLRDAQGSVVSGTQTALSISDATVVVFRPDAELQPESTYTYTCPLRDGSEFTFTTGAGPRLGTPPVPDPSRWTARAVRQDDAPDNYLVTFDDAAEPYSMIVLDVGGAASVDVEGPSGVLSDITEALYRVGVSVGSGSCEDNWPEATLGASTTVALGAFDVTGAFSGWSDTVTVTIPDTLDEQSSGDSVTVGDAAPSVDIPPGSASASSDARPPNGCGLARMPDGSWMAAGAFAALTGLAAGRRRRHQRANRQAE